MTNGIIKEKVAKTYKKLLKDKRLSKKAKGIAGTYFADIERRIIESINDNAQGLPHDPYIFISRLIGDQN